MAVVYILYSPLLDKYYIGSCKDFAIRFDEHSAQIFSGSFTSKANDWVPYFLIEDLEFLQARKIEGHIKAMKSKKFISSLKKYPEISLRLIELYT